MNVISMMQEINLISNPMIRESALPDFLLSTDDASEFMRISALDKLDRALDCDIDRGSQQKMNVFRHKDKSVQFVAAFTTMSIQGVQKETCVQFDNEQLSASVGRERCEISSRRGDESSRLQGETSAAGSRASFKTLNWHELNSCPSRLFFDDRVLFWEDYGPVRRVADSAEAGEIWRGKRLSKTLWPSIKKDPVHG